MRKQRSSTITAVLLLFAPFIVSCAGASDSRTASATPTPSSPDQIQTTPGTLAPGPSQTLHSLQQHFIDLVTLVRPSVVKIATDKGLGSGVIYDARGDIVTNAHVVGDATQFQVTGSMGR